MKEKYYLLSTNRNAVFYLQTITFTKHFDQKFTGAPQKVRPPLVTLREMNQAISLEVTADIPVIIHLCSLGGFKKLNHRKETFLVYQSRSLI